MLKNSENRNLIIFMVVKILLLFLSRGGVKDATLEAKDFKKCPRGRFRGQVCPQRLYLYCSELLNKFVQKYLIKSATMQLNPWEGQKVKKCLLLGFFIINRFRKLFVF